MHRKSIYKAIVAIAVAMAFVMPVAAVANVGTIGVISNSENTGDINNIEEIITSDETVGETDDHNLEEEPCIDCETEEEPRGPPVEISDSAATTTISLEGIIIYVDDDNVEGPWIGTKNHPYQYIQQGVDNATAGDTIYVFNGYYNEHVTVDKQLDLIGETRENAIIDGTGLGSGELLWIVGADNVSATNFTLRNSTYAFGVESALNSSIVNCDVHSNSRSSYIIYLYYASYTTIDNCAFYNNSGRETMWIGYSSDNRLVNCDIYNNGGGIRIQRSPNTILEGCNIYGNRGIEQGWGLYFYGGGQDNSVINCNIYDNTFGVYVKQTPTTLFRGNAIYDNDFDFSFEPYNAYEFYIDVDESNTINGKKMYWFEGLSNYEFDKQDAGYVAFLNCTNIVVKDIDVSGILMVNTTNSIISNVVVHNNKHGILLYDCSKIDIMDSEGYHCMNGVRTWTSPYTNITRGIFHDNIMHNCYDGCGIYLRGSPYSNIVDVTTYNNQGGITVAFGSSYSNVINCTSYNNYAACHPGGPWFGRGIRIYMNTKYCNVINCTTYNNYGEGIQLYFGAHYTNVINCLSYNAYGTATSSGISPSSSYYNNIENCVTYDCEIGIYVRNSKENTITNCEVYNNNYSLYTAYSKSKDNLFYHNNFFDNELGAYDPYPNAWDNGYPSGGNYWDDYTGVDEDGDGIGDTPYNISGDSNQDRYPLMIPWDETPPVITDVQATPAAQTPTDPVNITCTVTDNKEVDTVKVIIIGPEGFTLEEEMNEGSYWYEDTYTTLGVYYYYIWADDTRGNEIISDTYTFVITESDKPVSTVAPLSQWTKTTPFTVTAIAFDNTGVATVTLWSRYSSDGTDWTDWTSYGTDTEEPWSWSFTGNDGYYEFYSIAVDDEENVEDPPTTADASIGLDTVPPVTTIELDGTTGENDWYASNVDITLSATDTLSGIETTFYQIDSEYPELYTAPFTVSGDGEHTVQYYSFDNALNREATNTIDLKIDTTPPVTTHEFEGLIGSGGWFVTDVTVTLDAADATSGVNYTMYNLDGDWITYTEPFIVTEDDEYTLCYYSVDLAGIVEMTNEVDFKIEHDTTPPVTTHDFDGIAGDNDWFTSNVAVTLSAEDDSAGVDYTMYKLDEGEWTEYTGAILVTKDDIYILSYYSVDKVGNEEDVNEAELKIDQTPPTIKLDAEEMGQGKWLLIATVSDKTSGIAKVAFYVNGEYLDEVTEPPYILEISPNEGDTAQAIVFDNAGNDAVSAEVTPQSHSQPQSSSSSSVPWPFSWLFGLW